MSKLILKKGCAIFNGKEQITNYDWEDGQEFEDSILLYNTVMNKRALKGFTYTITIIDRNSGKELFKINKIKNFDVYPDCIFLSRYEGKMTDAILTYPEAVIDLIGNYIIPFGRYLSIDYVYNHFFVRSKDGAGLCDKYGKEKIKPKYSFINIVSEYCWCFFNKDDSKGIYFSVNDKCIYPVFKELYYYDAPKILIGVTEKGEKKLYDVKKGKEVLCQNIEECCNYYERTYMLTGRF